MSQFSKPIHLRHECYRTKSIRIFISHNFCYCHGSIFYYQLCIAGAAQLKQASLTQTVRGSAGSKNNDLVKEIPSCSLCTP